MPTFSNIGGAEPSTITFKLASVTQDRGGVTEHQEIVTIGGTESTLAVAAVLAGTPASTAWALAVREVAPTTSVRVAQSSAADLNVTVAGYVAPSTIVTVSTGSVRVHQSSAADLNVTVAGYVAPTTNVTISAIAAGLLSTAAPAANSSGLIVRVVGYVAPSTEQTVRQSTYTDLNGLMRLADRDASTATAAIVNATAPASSAYGLVVRLPSPVTDSTNNALRVNVVAGAAGGSTQVTVSQLLDSSGGSVTAADSANNAIRVNVVAGAAGGSTIVTVSTGSVRVHQSSAADLNVTVAGYSTTAQVSSLAGRVAIAGFHAVSGIVNVTDSTNNAINVNVVAGAAAGSTIVTVSTGSVRVHQSSAADLNVTVAGYVAPSTTVSVNGNASSNSSLYLPVRLTNGTAFLTPSQDYTDGSTASNIAAPTITFDNGTNATMRAVSSTLGLPVRVLPGASSLQSTCVVITSTHSTALYDLVSSVASVAHRVYSYFVSSTHTSPSTLVFMSSNAIDRYHVGFGSGSSGMTGANLAISPHGGAFLFRTDAGNALRCRIEGGSSVTSTVIARVSISFYTE